MNVLILATFVVIGITGTLGMGDWCGGSYYCRSSNQYCCDYDNHLCCTSFWTAGAIGGTVAGSLVFVGLVVCCIVCCRRRRTVIVANQGVTNPNVTVVNSNQSHLASLQVPSQYPPGPQYPGQQPYPGNYPPQPPAYGK